MNNPTESVSAEEARREPTPEVRTFSVNVCIPCINLSGDECHTPGCIFFLHSMDEVSAALNLLLIRPIVDGQHRRAA